MRIEREKPTFTLAPSDRAKQFTLLEKSIVNQMKGNLRANACSGLHPIQAAKQLIGNEQFDIFYGGDGKTGLTGPAAAGLALVGATAAVAAATVGAVATLAAAKAAIDIGRPLNNLNFDTAGLNVDQLLSLRNEKI